MDFQSFNLFTKIWVFIPAVWLLYIIIPTFFFDTSIDETEVFKQTIGILMIWAIVFIGLIVTGLDKKQSKDDMEKKIDEAFKDDLK